jgi:hypothetical protein
MIDAQAQAEVAVPVAAKGATSQWATCVVVEYADGSTCWLDEPLAPVAAKDVEAKGGEPVIMHSVERSTGRIVWSERRTMHRAVPYATLATTARAAVAVTKASVEPVEEERLP